MAYIMWTILFIMACFASASSTEEVLPEMILSELSALKKRVVEQDIVLEEMKTVQSQAMQVLQNSVAKLEKKVDEQNEFIQTLKHHVEKNKEDILPVKLAIRNVTIEERLEHLEEVAKIKVLKTCEELREHGVVKSGFYHIDPDGEQLGHSPIRVWCDFEANVTEVLHDADDIFINIPHCAEEHCYRKDYIYTSPMEQVTSLIQLSEACTQDISFDCLLAPLSLNDVQIGTWLDRFGDTQVYFTGSNYGDHMCSCHTNNTCTDEDIFGTKCNCDSNLPKWLGDFGQITNKSALPITAFNYGPLEYEMQQAKVKVGRLRCSGKTQVSSPPESCTDLKKMGETKSGYYPIKDKDSDSPQMVYCDMKEPGYEGDMETNMGWMKLSPAPGGVIFSVQQSTNPWTTAGILTYDVEVTNKGGAMNLETGIFTAPVDGLYEFSFSTVMYTTGNLNIHIMVNNALYTWIGDNYDTWYSTATRVWVLDLMKDDTVHLKFMYGSIYGSNHVTEFNGALI